MVLHFLKNFVVKFTFYNLIISYQIRPGTFCSSIFSNNLYNYMNNCVIIEEKSLSVIEDGCLLCHSLNFFIQEFCNKNLFLSSAMI